MKKDYKDTLFMGKTNFEMRGNLPNKEPLIYKRWIDEDIYNKVLEKNEGKRLYTLHDGPPYANGEIHIGHALNKTLKDFVIRYKNMNGYKAVYIPGWDTHGLPIETALAKKGIKRKEMSVVDFRKLCHDYALEQVQKQKEGFKRLGVLGYYDTPYLTLQKNFEKNQILIFASMVEKGLIYKGLKPVYWSYSSESALAEAEIEYMDKKDTSIYVKFLITSGNYKGASYIIWTTTPWTLPANLAVCAGENITYVLINSNKGNFILCKDRLDELTKLLELEDVVEIESFLGKELEGVIYKHPLFDRFGQTILGDHVTTTEGSGLVHTAPGHGEDDFNVSKKYNIDVLCPVDAKGYMTKDANEYEGLFYEDCSKQIIDDLEKNNLLLKKVDIIHAYPHDWRTKKPVIFRATSQWFASIDKIKDDLLNNIKDVKWQPKWGELRMSNMIKDRHDWCISRQRAWGVPIPVFYAEDDTPILDKEVLYHIANLFGEYGSDIWFTYDSKNLLPKGYKNEHSPNGIFRKETDIMDVWFDSGSSFMILNDYKLKYPADLYLEGSDQYRGWFNSSLITGVSLFGKAPYKQVLSHGFTLDGQGRKMSKSLGNTIDPKQVCNEFGADILRLWVSSIDYQSDMPISNDILKQVSDSYRKIRNTIKFMLSNISDLTKENLLDINELLSVDKYMYIKLQRYINDVKDCYDEFKFNEIYKLTNAYINNTLSAFYLDFTKDILYIEHPTSIKRLSVQTCFYHILLNLLKVLSPILCFTTSEAYQELPFKDYSDIYLEDMPKRYEITSELENNYDKFMQLREEILKKLEEARVNKIIGKSFNAKLVLYLPEEYENIINNLNYDIKNLLIVSQVKMYKSDELKIEVYEATGHVCDRCWAVVDTVNEDGICQRCEEVLKKL